MTTLRLIRPAPKAGRVVYPRVPLFGMKVTDRRESLQQRRDALESERNREAAQAQSKAHTTPMREAYAGTREGE